VAGNSIQAAVSIPATDNSVGILPLQQSGTVYVSYLINMGIWGSDDSNFLWFYNGATEKFRVGSVPWSSPAKAFGFHCPATTAWSTVVPADNTTYLLW